MRKSKSGFTIVELLIVIIAILAAITVVAYNGIQQRAKNAKVQPDLASLQKAIIAGRINTGQTLAAMTGVVSPAPHEADAWWSKPTATDIANLPKTDTCWTTYANALDKISITSGANVRGLIDPSTAT